MNTIWIDAQISPLIAKWINENFPFMAVSVKDLGFLRSKDSEIFNEAKRQNTIIMTKDIDFLRLLEQYGPPPAIIWITSGNTSNANLKEILKKNLTKIVTLLENGEPLVEISSK